MRLIILLICCLYCITSLADSGRDLNAKISAQVIGLDAGSLELKDLVLDEQGFLTNTSSDGFFKLHDLNITRNQACYLQLDLQVTEPMFRPGVFEIFWATTPNSYAESQKASVIVTLTEVEQPQSLIIPLCKLYRFSGNLNSPNLQKNILGFRLDFPSNRTMSIKVSNFELLSHAQFRALPIDRVEAMTALEPYERIPGKAFTSIDVVIPKLFFGLESGFKRLANDPWFLLFWLSLILTCVFLIARSFVSRN